MAKAAKSVEIEISDKLARNFLTDIFDHLANIESAKGVYMNLARGERDQMVSLYENMASHGVSQRVSKLTVKIAVALEKIKGWQSEIEDEERKIAIKMAKALGDKRQLSLWSDLQTVAKPRKPRASKPSNVVQLDLPSGAA